METQKHLLQTTELVSTDEIIKCIQQTRDRLIDDLLNEPLMMDFVLEHFNTVAMTQVKLDYIKRGLIELKGSHLDLAHYSPLIKQMKETQTTLVNANHRLFLMQLKAEFKKYGFYS
ncbi:MAG TPA: hypothetical protein VL728_07755 [Cyclobacteriaceae bacterium]|jgi:hypothetical protein|nr:hypothetical protein [Cyclobacteriaceae bacterium]